MNCRSINCRSMNCRSMNCCSINCRSINCRVALQDTSKDHQSQNGSLQQSLNKCMFHFSKLHYFIKGYILLHHSQFWTILKLLIYELQSSVFGRSLSKMRERVHTVCYESAGNRKGLSRCVKESSEKLCIHSALQHIKRISVNQKMCPCLFHWQTKAPSTCCLIRM